MTFFLRRNGLILFATLPMFAGCVGSGCDYLVYEGEVPSKARPVVMPAGVPAPPEGGEFRIPDGPAQQITGRCPAQPPMTLDPELLKEPEEGETPAEEAPADA